ncbi:hypothetical protein CPB86DRAFT_773489 [Serendipita vermifera]|nr:hypothetical protein CPB86DRAFT_773489 [Serendipita vermifera]
MSATIEGDGVREWKIQAQSEYRFEVDAKRPIAIKVTDGNAEVFGSEMAPGRMYLFSSECKAAIFSWEGCTIQIRKPSTEYVSDETTMTAYANLHLIFEQMRIRARHAERGAAMPEEDHNMGDDHDHEPPRLLIIGPEHSGKTTACKILANYAVRGMATYTPLYINLDPSEGGFTIPGTLSACPIDSPIPTSSPANPLGITATSAPTALSSSKLIPLVQWYGHADVAKNPRLVEHLIRVLYDGVAERLEDDVPLARTSGLFIDTPSNFTSVPLDDKYTLVKTTVHAFRVNMIVVIGNEKLTVEMQKLFAEGSYTHHKVTVLKIPRSAGVADLDMAYRDRIQAYQLKNYFYGAPLQLPKELESLPPGSLKLGGEASMELSLAPHSTVIAFDDIHIYRIGQESFAPSSALPIGASRILGEMKPTKIDPSQPGSRIVNSILAVTTLTEVPQLEEDIVDADIMGFIVITAMDMDNKKMTILAPVASSLTGRIAITGSFQWQDL